MDVKDLEKAIKEAKKRAKPRNFKQSVELAINLRDIDLKRPENRVDVEVYLPNGRGKDSKIGVFATGDLALNAKKLGLTVIDKDEIPKLKEDKRRAKKLASEIKAFLAQPDLMPVVGKNLGMVLGPRGKMPKPLPPVANLKAMVERVKNTVRLRSKDKPVVHCPIGVEDMDDKALAENAMEVINAVANKLPKGMKNIASVYVKLTMGPAVKV